MPIEKINPIDWNKDPEIFIHPDNFVLSNVKSNIWNIIENKQSLSHWEDTVDYVLPHFIDIADDGLYLNFQKISWSSEFKNFVDEIFMFGYYFEKVDYQKILSFAYDDNSFIKPEGLKIKIATKIKKINPDRIKLYKNFRISRWQVDFIFDRTPFLHNDENLENFNFDELISVLWSNWIKYWLLEDEILKAIHSNESIKLIIAKDKLPIDGKDSSKEMVDSHMIMDLSPVERENGLINYRQLKNKIPQVEAKVILYKKIPIQVGQDGVDICWNILQQKHLKDFDLSYLAWEWTYVTVIEWVECLCSSIKWYLLEDRKTKRLSVKEKIPPLKSDINTSTGNLEILGYEFELIGNIIKWFNLTGNFLNIRWDVHGLALSKGWYISINGNIVWVWGDNYYGVDAWYVENEEWDIKIAGNLVSRAEIVSRKWKIDVNWVKIIELSRLIWNDIDWYFIRDSIIIGNNIKFKKARNCIFIGTNIEVWEIIYDDKQYWTNEITIVTKWNIVKMKKEIKDYEWKESLKQKEIDTLIALNKIIVEFFTKVGLQLDVSDKDIFDTQTKVYLERYKIIAPKLKDKSYILSLDDTKKRQLAHFILLVNNINEYNARFIEIKNLQDAKRWIWEEKQKIENIITEISSLLSCNIWIIGDVLIVKSVELEYSFNFLDVELDKLLKLLSNNLSLKQVFRTGWNKESYNFSL